MQVNTDEVPKLVEEEAIVPTIEAVKEFNTAYELGGHGDERYWDRFFRESKMADFGAEAYKNKSGYAIRINPTTGNKEMFLAGSRTVGDWGSNLAEAVDLVPGVQWGPGVFSEELRHDYALSLDDIIEREGVVVVYGHSRGGAVTSDLKSSVKIIDLDGATIIGSKRDIFNISTDGVFDGLINGGGNENTLVMKGRAFHNVLEPKGGDKLGWWDWTKDNPQAAFEPIDVPITRAPKRIKSEPEVKKKAPKRTNYDSVTKKKKPKKHKSGEAQFHELIMGRGLRQDKKKKKRSRRRKRKR